MWLMPQMTDTKYSAQVYLEQLANGLRTRDTPQEFINQLYTTAGDTVFYAALKAHEAALAQTGSTGGAATAEYARFSAETAQMQQQMPIWASTFDTNTRLINGQQGITQLNAIYSAGQQGTGEQAVLVGQLLDMYNTALVKYTQAGTQQNYSSAQSLVRKNYELSMVNMAAAYPQLAPVVSALFKDALTATAQGLGA